jgi:hypothetical protein
MKSSVRFALHISEVAKDRRKLASEGVKLLHSGQREAHQRLEVLDLARRIVRKTIGELGGLPLQPDQVLQRPVAQLLG